MSFSAKIIADSISYSNDSRLTTMELTYPLIIHAEFMTHRAFSRNAASSRAIPVKKMLERVKTDPFIPSHWGKNQEGMQAYSELTEVEQNKCRDIWLEQRDSAVFQVERLLEIGLHKQIANRLLGPWMWITVIASGTDYAWQNFFGLRCHEATEPHIQKIAYSALDLYRLSCPVTLIEGEWHLPLFGFEGDQTIKKNQRSSLVTARTARVSYLTHAGLRDVEADLGLHDRLRESGHWSPFEHAAMATKEPGRGGNFRDGWLQYRKTFKGECRKFEI